MIRLLNRWIRRALVLALGAFTVWLIVFVIFRTADNRLPWIVAVALTYVVAAYVVLPRTVRMSLKVLQRRRVPRYTITTDGLPGDPVNLLLKGTHAQLHAAFAGAGWTVADPLTVASSWHMVRAFLLNRPYPTAPFQHALPLRPRPGSWLSESNRQQPTPAPPRTLLGIEPWAHRSHAGQAQLLAQ
jgi:hypothetical protein